MCPQFHSPLFLIVIFARIYKTVTCDTMCSGRPCENSLQSRRVEGQKYLYENITKVYMVFKSISKQCFSVYMQISKRKETKTSYSQILQTYRYASLEKNTAVLPCWELQERYTSIHVSFAEIYIMKMSRNGCKFVMACNDFHKIKHKNKYNYREIKE